MRSHAAVRVRLHTYKQRTPVPKVVGTQRVLMCALPSGRGPWSFASTETGLIVCLCFSDVVVQIVDARNPLLFRCQDLVSANCRPWDSREAGTSARACGCCSALLSLRPWARTVRLLGQVTCQRLFPSAGMHRAAQVPLNLDATLLIFFCQFPSFQDTDRNSLVPV